jgi:hypothetical protein
MGMHYFERFPLSHMHVSQVGKSIFVGQSPFPNDFNGKLILLKVLICKLTVYFCSRRRKEIKTEYKKRFRPFSQYEYVDGRFNKRKQEAELMALEPPPPNPSDADVTPSTGEPWYKECAALRKKAGEYKVGYLFDSFIGSIHRIYAADNLHCRRQKIPILRNTIFLLIFQNICILYQTRDPQLTY